MYNTSDTEKTAMRVVSGFARGHKLICLEGESVRPTSDRVKEAIFSALSERLYGSRFLDMFSGSGAIGIEALSRGASYVAFVEESSRHTDIIKKNLDHVSKAIPDANYNLFEKDALESIETLKSLDLQFDIIFLDPPYELGLWKDVLTGIQKSELLSEDGIIILEISKDEKEPVLPHFNIAKKKFYGSTAVYYMEIYE